AWAGPRTTRSWRTRSSSTTTSTARASAWTARCAWPRAKHPPGNPLLPLRIRRPCGWRILGPEQRISWISVPGDPLPHRPGGPHVVLVVGEDAGPPGITCDTPRGLGVAVPADRVLAPRVGVAPGEPGHRRHDLEPQTRGETNWPVTASCTSTHCGDEMNRLTSSTAGTPLTTATVASGPNRAAVES